MTAPVTMQSDSDEEERRRMTAPVTMQSDSDEEERRR